MTQLLPPDQGPFVGRETERRQVARCAEEAIGGQAWAVLVEGAAGTGKTALLRHGVPGQGSFVVLRAACDPGEAGLPFGVVSQLLRRARRRAGAQTPKNPSTAGPARRITTRRRPADVGAQLLDVVDAAQADAPLAIVVDDVQWADPASTEALGYLLRRLDAARVLTLLAARTRHSEPAEWVAGQGEYWRRLIDDRHLGRRLRLPGLTADEVAELAAELGHGPIPLVMAERLRRHTGGDPAAARALLAGPLPEGLADPDGQLPVPGPVAAQVGELLAGLAPASRSLLDALAVLDARCPLALVARVAEVPDPVAALEWLLGAEIVSWWPEDPATPVQIRLPVQRDAVYRRLAPGRRRELHVAAAAAVRADAKWAHRVAAVTGANPVLAGELDRAAVRAQRSGAVGRAGTLLFWSAGLSDDRDSYERRLIAAAAEFIWSHSRARAQTLRPQLAECGKSPLRDLVLAALDSRAVTPAAVADALAATGPAGAYLAPAAARAALASLGEAADEFQHAIARQVLAVGGLDRETRTMARCLAAEAAGAAVVTEAAEAAGVAGAAGAGGAAVPAERARSGDAIVLWRRGVLRARAGRLTGAADDLSAALQLNCGHGDVAVRASTLLAYLQYLLGQWTAARLTADQAIGLALTRGATSSYVRAYAVAACVAASSGALDRAEGLLRTSRRWSRAAGRASDVLYPAVAGAVLAQAAGDHPAMLAAIEPLSGPPGGEDLWWWPLRAEALIGAGHLDEAAKELSGVTAESVPPSLRAGHAWLAGWLARLRGDLDAALSLYAGALDGGSEPGADDIPLLRARLEHAYGSLLLARRSRRAAVHWLRAARERYRALGAAPFLARCDTELASWGLRAVAAGPGPYGPRNVLSAQEGRVARLVAQGMTNQEVARRLYVSPKTVEFHLSNVFTKLGIASRRQLRPGMLEPLRA